MKASKLIKELEELIEKHGDLSVYAFDGCMKSFRCAVRNVKYHKKGDIYCPICHPNERLFFIRTR